MFGPFLASGSGVRSLPSFMVLTTTTAPGTLHYHDSPSDQTQVKPVRVKDSIESNWRFCVGVPQRLQQRDGLVHSPVCNCYLRV